MTRPLDLIVEEMLDYIEQARTYAGRPYGPSCRPGLNGNSREHHG
jgi:hypothetical protein